jgi:hypothetical protein
LRFLRLDGCGASRAHHRHFYLHPRRSGRVGSSRAARLYSLVRQSFTFTLFKAKRLKHLHRAIDLSAQIWNHCVALDRRYYKLFGKGLAKASSRPTLPSCATSGSRTGKRWAVKASWRSLNGSIWLGQHFLRATAHILQTAQVSLLHAQASRLSGVVQQFPNTNKSSAFHPELG